MCPDHLTCGLAVVAVHQLQRNRAAVGPAADVKKRLRDRRRVGVRDLEDLSDRRPPISKRRASGRSPDATAASCQRQGLLLRLLFGERARPGQRQWRGGGPGAPPLLAPSPRLVAPWASRSCRAVAEAAQLCVRRIESRRLRRARRRPTAGRSAPRSPPSRLPSARYRPASRSCARPRSAGGVAGPRRAPRSPLATRQGRAERTGS